MPYIIDAEEFAIEQRRKITTYYNTNRLKLTGFEPKQRFIYCYLHETKKTVNIVIHNHTKYIILYFAQLSY